MRLFTGLDIPPDVVANLETLLQRLKPSARIRWSPPANLHITTKFIGELAEERLQDLEAALAAIPSRDALEVRVRGLGFYPNPHSPRIFWAGVEAPGLEGLAADTDEAVASVSVSRETKETKGYSPHLTLARIKDKNDLHSLREAVAGLDSLEFGGFRADRFFLYRSTLKPSGSVYTKLADFPLTKP